MDFDGEYKQLLTKRKPSTIGEGSEGRVEAYQQRNSGEMFAVKWMKRAGHSDEVTMIEKLARTVCQRSHSYRAVVVLVVVVVVVTVIFVDAL